MNTGQDVLKSIVTAILGVMACSGCATSKTAVHRIGYIDEEGCVLRAHVEHANQVAPTLPVDASSSLRWRVVALESYGDLPDPVPSTAWDANKIVRGSSYVDYYTCPTVTIPEKRPD